jgi:hypothetical protein
MATMLSYGIEITAPQQEACFERMRAGGFRAKEIETLLVKLGVPETSGYSFQPQYPALRAADRLIQNMRKAGNLRHSGGIWNWIA